MKIYNSVEVMRVCDNVNFSNYSSRSGGHSLVDQPSSHSTERTRLVRRAGNKNKNKNKNI